MLTIVRNLSLNKLRDERRAENVPDDELPEQADLSDAIEDASTHIVLASAMSVLTREEREIVVLHALTGYRHREIAEILEMPQSTVLSRYNRALKKMKKEINGNGDA